MGKDPWQRETRNLVSPFVCWISLTAPGMAGLSLVCSVPLHEKADFKPYNSSSNTLLTLNLPRQDMTPFRNFTARFIQIPAPHRVVMQRVPLTADATWFSQCIWKPPSPSAFFCKAGDRLSSSGEGWAIKRCPHPAPRHGDAPAVDAAAGAQG